VSHNFIVEAKAKNPSLMSIRWQHLSKKRGKNKRELKRKEKRRGKNGSAGLTR